MHVNPNFQTLDRAESLDVEFVCESAELDEQWSYVGNKSNQRWLWYAIDHATNTILAFVFGRRKDIIFKKLRALLEPFGINLIGEHMNVTWPLIVMKLAKPIRKRSNEKT